MTAHPIDTEALRRLADDHRAMGHDPTADAIIELLGALAAAEHRATRAEARIQAVRELHTPREEQVITGDCFSEECDHEDECPTVPFLVYVECWRVADEADTYFSERGVGPVAHPCPTIRALDGGPMGRVTGNDRC